MEAIKKRISTKLKERNIFNEYTKPNGIEILARHVGRPENSTEKTTLLFSRR